MTALDRLLEAAERLQDVSARCADSWYEGLALSPAKRGLRDAIRAVDVTAAEVREARGRRT